MHNLEYAPAKWKRKKETKIKSMTDTKLFIPKKKQADGVFHQRGEGERIRTDLLQGMLRLHVLSLLAFF